MHLEAREWVKQFANDRPLSVIEIGSLNVNGTIRDQFPNASWIGIDRMAGNAVDVVCDAETYRPQHLCDAVICCEVLEHADNWNRLIHVAYSWLKPSGVFIVTCAGLGRQEHSCDGGKLKPNEYYRNLSPADVRAEIQKAGFAWCFVRQFQTDIQGFAVKSPHLPKEDQVFAELATIIPMA